MVLRAQKHGRKDKVQVFKRREKKYESIINSLKQESVTAQPVLVAQNSRPTSKPSPSPSTQSYPTASSISSKKGLGFNRIIDFDPFTTSWGYNWDSRLPSGESMPSNRQFVPMLWKPDQDHLSHWEDDVEAALKKGGITHLLG